MRLLELKKVHLFLCIVFSVLGLAWIFLSNPMFPVSSVYNIQLPFRFPVLGLIIPCWLLYFNQKRLSILWLLLVVPIVVGFNVHMLRPDMYFLWLCLLSASICKNKEQMYASFLLILGGMYLWTAIQKMHIDFVLMMASVFDKRIIPSFFPSISSKLIAGLIPIMEFTLAILCFTRLVKARRVLAIILHGGIIYFLLVGGWNSTMVAWNIALVLFHFLLPAFQNTESGIRIWQTIPALSIFFPVLYFVGVWPVFASWAMYSSRLEHYRLVLDEQTAIYPPEYIRDFVYIKDGQYMITLTTWADAELGGAPCMEPLLKEKVLQDCRTFIKNYP
jgi:hypothetical protein